MSLLINIPDRPLDKLVAKLTEFIPVEEIKLLPDVKEPAEIDFALVWKHQHGSLMPFKNLKAISSFGAGVDSIIEDPLLPDVPIARIVDADLAMNMGRFVLSQVLSHRLRATQFQQQQERQIWKPKSPRSGNKVGILGLGQLGIATANTLSLNGFEVLGWSRTQKNIDGVTCLSGEDGFQALLPQIDYLVCLLPLTEQTQGILNKSMFEQLPSHCVVINVARGLHLVEADLIWALDSGELDFAFLDVFQTEPLPEAHDFWTHPKIQITPHVSAVTNVDTAVKQVVENYQRCKEGLPLLNMIDSSKGY